MDMVLLLIILLVLFGGAAVCTGAWARMGYRSHRVIIAVLVVAFLLHGRRRL